MHLHFDGPPQIRAGLNMTYTALLSTVYYAVKAIVDPTIPPNSGLARPLRVTAPEGTVVNCVHPAAVNGRLSLCQRVVDLIFGALAQAVPDRVTAASNGACFSITFAGHQPDDNRLWVYLETIGGGSGARPTKDGLDGVHVHMTNTSNLPVEALETEYPLTLLRYELVDGSGGPRTLSWRNGATAGLPGGGAVPGSCRWRAVSFRALGSRRRRSRRQGERHGCAAARTPFNHGHGGLRAGEIIDITIAGAGGHGPPEERDRALVARDLAERPH